MEETKIKVSGSDGRLPVYHRTGERANENCIVETQQFRQKQISRGVICRPTGAKWPRKKPPKRSPTRARQETHRLPPIWCDMNQSFQHDMEPFLVITGFSSSDASFIILTKSVKWRESRARTENLQNAVKPYHCRKCYCVCDNQFIRATH